MKKWFALLMILAMVIPLVACSIENLQMEEVPFEEIVVVDNEEYKVVVTNVDTRIHYIVEVLLENRGTQTLSLSAACFVNGVSFTMNLSTGGFEAVEPGEKKTITFGFMDLREHSIGAITDVEMQFDVLEAVMGSSAWLSVSELDAVHFYPQGEENASVYELVPQKHHEVIVDNEYVTVTVVGYGSMDEAKMHIANHTDTELLVRVKGDRAELNRSIQGRASLFVPVPAQAQAFGTLWPLYPGADDGEVHDFINTEFISFSLEVTGGGVWYTSDTITLSPSGRSAD